MGSRDGEACLMMCWMTQYTVQVSIGVQINNQRSTEVVDE